MHKKVEKWFIIGIPILVLTSFLFHSLYEWTNHNFIIGLLFPHNESIFAHMKLVLWPIPIYFMIIYFCKRKEIDSLDRFFTAMLVSLVVSLITIPMLYYFYTGAFGFDSKIIDIAIGVISVILGMLAGRCVYKYSSGINYLIAIAFTIFLFIAFAILTIYPPDFPIFLDKQFTK